MNTDTSNNEIPAQEINIDDLLELENQQNKKETWGKLNRTLRLHLLHNYAEKYGKENGAQPKEVKQLKQYLTISLDTKKLNRAKDLAYDRDKQEIINIPHLFFHPITRVFTLRNESRISTLKSLGPRKTEKNKGNET